MSSLDPADAGRLLADCIAAHAGKRDVWVEGLGVFRLIRLPALCARDPDTGATVNKPERWRLLVHATPLAPLLYPDLPATRADVAPPGAIDFRRWLAERAPDAVPAFHDLIAEARQAAAERRDVQVSHVCLLRIREKVRGRGLPSLWVISSVPLDEFLARL